MKRLLLILFLFPLFCSAQTFNGTGGAIPDFPGGEACFNVNVSGLPQNLYASFGLLTVTIDITHPYDSDLEIVLESPSGVRTILSSNNGGSGDNYTATVFDMGAVAPIQLGSAPFTGSYIPEESFYAQNSGQNGNGIWRLCITDEIGGEVGTLNSWSISFGGGATGASTPNPNPVATDSCFNAPLICNLNGYTGSTNTTYTWSGASPFEAEPRGTSQGPNAGSFCGTHVENSSWIRFQASQTTVTLDVDVTNCTGTVASCGERGIQIALYTACGFPWTYSGSTIPTSSFADCFNDEQAPSCYGDGIFGLNQMVTFNNLTVGNIYYIMFDGWAANQCDYTIRVNNGVQTVDITPSSNPMCEGDTITLIATAPGVLNTYAWSSVPSGSYVNNDTITVFPTSTTVFTVTASGICGSESTSLPITVTPSGDPSWNTPPDICENATPFSLTTYVTGTQGGSWSGTGVVGSTFDPTGLSGNIPVVYTTGTSPCQRTDTNMIFVLPVPDPVISVNSPTSICDYETVLLSATSPVTGAFLWNTGSTNDSVWTDTSGQYIVTVTAGNGCFDSDTLDLSVTTFPDPNAMIVGNPVICPGGTTDLTLSNTYVSYLWSTTSVNDSIQVVSPGLYDVIVTDGNGCQDTAQITVVGSNVSASVNGNSPICSYETSTLSAGGGGTYNWSTTATDSTITVPAGGWYWVDVTDSLGCTDRDSIFILQSNLNALITGDSIVCSQNDSSLLSASTANSYLWNNSQNSQNIYVYLPGNYSVILTDTLGCQDTAYFSVSQSSVNASISGDTIACLDEVIVLTASGGGTYSWNTGETSASITPTVTQTFTYQVTVTNSEGCTSTALTNVQVYNNLFPPPVAFNDSSQTGVNTPVLVDVLTNDTINSGGIVVFQGPSNGTVTIIGNEIEYTPNAGFVGTDVFYYLLCNTDCIDYCDTAAVTIRISNDILVFPEFISPNGDGSNDTWIIEGIENFPENELVIMNRWGDALYTAAPYNNEWAGQSNTGMVAIDGTVTDGAYFFVLTPSPGSDPIKGFIELRK